MTEDLATRLTAMTRALVQKDSQTPPSDTGAVLQTVRSVLEAVPGLTLKSYVSDAPVENLVAVLDYKL